MRIDITAEAETDLEAIGKFIAFENPRRAAMFLSELLASCERIALAPLGSPLMDGFERVGLRRRPHGRYVILYRVKEDRVEVIHVVHGARDYRAMLNDFE